MRAGILDRLGFDFESLKSINPKIVFCSVSGLGRYGPYAKMGSHGPSFDAFAALTSVNPYALTKEERIESGITPVGMHAMGLFAALGALSAVIRAKATGEGALIEVAAAECAAHWMPDIIDAELNKDICFDRPGFLGGNGKQANWSRLCRYECGDGRGMLFQALSPKFWDRFCKAVDRPDLGKIYDEDRDVNDIDEDVHEALCTLFLKRNFSDWMQLFAEHDVPAGPANSRETLVTDPHFLARDNVYDVDLPGTGTIHLTTTPVKTPDQKFSPTLAPEAGEMTESILKDWLDLDAGTIEKLRKQGALV
tara:strand:- start:596 stop:1519 length:924 start_codon:yes stop_codon:yes gene_type:complete